MSGSDLRFLQAVSPLPAPFLPLPSANGIFPITRWQIGQSTQLSLKVFAAGMLQCQLPFVHADQPLNDRFLVAALRRRAPPSMSDLRGSESVSAYRIGRIVSNSCTHTCRHEPRGFQARPPHLGVAEPCVSQGGNDRVRLARCEDVGRHIHPIHMRLREEAQHDSPARLENACQLRGSSSKAFPEVHCVDAEGLVECGIGQRQVLDLPYSELGASREHCIAESAGGSVHDVL